MNERLRRLYDKRALLVREADAILERASAEDRELSTEEAASVEERTNELKAIERRIALEEQVANHAAFNNPNPNHSVSRISASAPAQNQGFETQGEFLVAVMRAGIPGGQVDPRLIPVRAGGAGMNEQSPTDGGFLVQTEQSNELLNRAYETGILTSRVRRLQIGANANGIKMNAVVDTSRANGARYGGLQLYWTDEGGQKTHSAPKFRPLEIKLQKLTGLCYATDELLEDATALANVINQAFPEEFGFVLDDAIWRGSGAGQPLGFMNSPCLVTVLKESGQLSGTIMFQNIVKMYARFFSRAKTTGNAAWFHNANILPQLMQMSAGGTATVYGMPVFIPPGGVSGSPYATLMGLPMVEVEHAESVGTTGDIVLADMSQYLMIEKGGLKTASSMHVRFIYDEQTFRWVYRCNGQPVWNAPITPYKGTSDTISPFICLETR